MIYYIFNLSHVIIQYTKYVANIFGLANMSSDAVYSILLYSFVISSVINYRKFSLYLLVWYKEFSV